MIQGTGSHVGKSILVAAFCRIFAEQNIRVAPFKAQNMALNSFITQEGGEIGRAQAFQAFAAGIIPSVDMNPILLKPSSDKGSQIIIHGKVYGNMDAKTYHAQKKNLRVKVKESLLRLRKHYDVIILEGAGSPAEINLKDQDIVNMGAAKMANAPVLLVGDIDRGGVFASLYGTTALLNENERAYFKGMIINKFRGDISLLEPGLTYIEGKTSLPVLGVIPYFRDLYLPEEDSVGLKDTVGSHDGAIKLGVIHLPHISNFTDFDALSMEPDISVKYIDSYDTLEGFDAIFVPGSKNTLNDLDYLRKNGLASRITDFASKGGTVVGLCGGYQILGKSIRDPEHVESRLEAIEGLGLLNVETTLSTEKTTTLDSARLIDGEPKDPLKGYEIHMGVTRHGEHVRPIFEILKRNGRSCAVQDGAINEKGTVWGTYLHGIFDNDGFRHAFLNSLRKKKGLPSISHSGVFYRQRLEESVEKLSKTVSYALDMEKITDIIRQGVTS